MTRPPNWENHIRHIPPICRDTTDWQPDKPVKAWNRLGATVSTEGQKDGINPPRLISSSKITLADGHWHHIAMSVKSESSECFSLVDGIKTSWECGAFVIQTGGTIVLGSDQGNLAGGSFEARNAFYGRISRVLVYTTALNQVDLSMKTAAVGEAPTPYKTFADFSFLGGTKLLRTDLKVEIKNCPPGGGYLGKQTINATSNAANTTNATINIKGSGKNPVTLQTLACSIQGCSLEGLHETDGHATTSLPQESISTTIRVLSQTNMTLFAAKSLFDGGATIKSYFVQGVQLLDKGQASMHSWSQTCEMEPLERCISKRKAPQSNEGHLCFKARQLCASLPNGGCKGIWSVLNADSSGVSCSLMKCFDIKFKKNNGNNKISKNCVALYDSVAKIPVPDAHWRLDDNIDGLFSTVRDFSSNNHDGIQFKGQSPLGMSSGFRFNSEAFISVPYSPALNTKDFTLSIWAKFMDDGTPTNASTAYKTYSIFSSMRENKQDGDISKTNNGEGMFVGIDGGKWVVWLGLGGQKNRAELKNKTVVPNVWTHVAVSYGASLLTLFVDGIPETKKLTDPFVPNTDSSCLVFMAAGGCSGTKHRFTGVLDDVEFFSGRVLPPNIIFYALAKKESWSWRQPTTSPFNQSLPTAVTPESNNEVLISSNEVRSRKPINFGNLAMDVIVRTCSVLGCSHDGSHAKTSLPGAPSMLELFNDDDDSKLKVTVKDPEDDGGNGYF